MGLFSRKPESPQQIAAEERLDEVTREVASQQLDEEAGREAGMGLRQTPGLAPARWPGVPGPLAWLGLRRRARRDRD